ncbi:immunity protein Imm33 domain-containing protein [Kistimonas asteriae]|uniref:immunity protein Imm33 domain-containing protein n=1 Tax=Kistimonas asteriae TaxID=517724 RepID=UPI001BA8299B|nr:hypothetical protein [Kistimonas asteriae]
MKDQKEICKKFETMPFPCNGKDKLGIAIDTIGKLPINGLRHMPEKGTSGWYIWCGEELSDSPDFFNPIHVEHIEKYLPNVNQYLLLPPGYRFLITNKYEDVWYDPQLTTV